ncbi:MAG: ABC transporter ATP-binding protein [Clostridia bacterium]|nr:ABC transporter ATP-binding protein [Clostridia bacterium]
MMKEKKTSEKGKAWLKQEMRPYRASIAFITVLYVLATAASLAFAYFVQFLVKGAEDKNTQSILLFSGILLGILVVKIGSHVFYNYQSEKIRGKMTAEKRTVLFGKLLRADYATVGKYHSGDLLNRMTSDLSEVVVDSVGLPPSLIGMAVQCAGAIAALITLDPLFTGLYVSCGIVGGGVMALFRKKVKQYHKQFMQADGDSRAFIQEGLSSLLTIKAYGAENRMSERSLQQSNEYYRTRMKRNLLRTFMTLLATVLGNVGLIFAVIWCSFRMLNGEMEFGMMLSVVLLLNQLQQPFASISGIVPVIFSRQASAERLAEITLEVETKASPDSHVDYDDFSALHLEDISFDYGREKVLNSVSMSINKGETICIVGNSGSGKSTLFKLMLGVYEPTSGAIQVESVEGTRLAGARCINHLFAYVPQGNFLFTGTIRENVLFFAEQTPSDEEIRQVLMTAQAGFVFDLPDGLDTLLTERGAGLSEGQQQRLAIARALLSNRPILLLDESTSALDSQTEKELLSAIQALQNKTCVLVTHRPAALAIANRVYEILDGEVSVK